MSNTLIYVILLFFFPSRSRHTRCAFVTGVQTCALPIYPVAAGVVGPQPRRRPALAAAGLVHRFRGVDGDPGLLGSDRGSWVPVDGDLDRVALGQSLLERGNRVAAFLAADLDPGNGRASRHLVPRPGIGPGIADGNQHEEAEHSQDDYSAAVARSEEHTSELQSLMRISYAVF